MEKNLILEQPKESYFYKPLSEIKFICYNRKVCRVTCGKYF